MTVNLASCCCSGPNSETESLQNVHVFADNWCILIGLNFGKVRCVKELEGLWLQVLIGEQASVA